MAKFYQLNHVLGKFYFDGDMNLVSNPGKDQKIFNLNSLKFPEKLILALKKIDFDYNKVFEISLKETKKKISEKVSSDSLIIQAVNSMDELNKTINLLSKRLREWFSLYKPRLNLKISDNERFVDFIVNDNYDSFSDDMDGSLSKDDISIIKSLALEIKSKILFRNKLRDYIEVKVRELCPNTSKYLGEIICAKLISSAGSFRRLVFFPASTIQLLGAEKALFRHLKDSRHKGPKYGVILQHSIMSKVKASERGKVARILANFASRSLKLDYVNKKYSEDKLDLIAKSVKELINIYEK